MKRIITRFYNGFYTKIFPNYPVELKNAVGNCKSLLDVGCGSSSPIKLFSRNLYCVGVDTFKPSIDKSKKQKIHNKYVQMSIMDIVKKFEPNSFDCVLASDVIEHLEKKDGFKLIEMIETIARKKVIVFTPNGFLKQGEYDKNPWQVHKSGWTEAEMKNKGFKVIGINGWKPLRGEFADIRFWPKYLWTIISDITQVFIKNRHCLC